MSMKSADQVVSTSFRVFECKSCNCIFINQDELDNHKVNCQKHLSSLPAAPAAPPERKKAHRGKYTFKPVGKSKQGRPRKSTLSAIVDDTSVTPGHTDRGRKRHLQSPHMTGAKRISRDIVNAKGKRSTTSVAVSPVAQTSKDELTMSKSPTSTTPTERFDTGVVSPPPNPRSSRSGRLVKLQYDETSPNEFGELKSQAPNSARRVNTFRANTTPEAGPLYKLYKMSTDLPNNLNMPAPGMDVIVLDTPEAKSAAKARYNTDSMTFSYLHAANTTTTTMMKERPVAGRAIEHASGSGMTMSPAAATVSKSTQNGSSVPALSADEERKQTMAVLRSGDYLCRYLASRDFSDISIMTSMGNIPAHKIVLASRYPQLAQGLLCVTTIDMSALSYGHVTAWLKYIYTDNESALPAIPANVLSLISQFILQSSSGTLSAIKVSSRPTAVLSVAVSTPVTTNPNPSTRTINNKLSIDMSSNNLVTSTPMPQKVGRSKPQTWTQLKAATRLSKSDHDKRSLRSTRGTFSSNSTPNLRHTRGEGTRLSKSQASIKKVSPVSLKKSVQLRSMFNIKKPADAVKSGRLSKATASIALQKTRRKTTGKTDDKMAEKAGGKTRGKAEEKAARSTRGIRVMMVEKKTARKAEGNAAGDTGGKLAKNVEEEARERARIKAGKKSLNMNESEMTKGTAHDQLGVPPNNKCTRHKKNLPTPATNYNIHKFTGNSLLSRNYGTCIQSGRSRKKRVGRTKVADTKADNDPGSDKRFEKGGEEPKEMQFDQSAVTYPDHDFSRIPAIKIPKLSPLKTSISFDGRNISITDFCKDEASADVPNLPNESSESHENASKLYGESSDLLEKTSGMFERTSKPAEKASETSEKTLETAEETSEPLKKTSEPAKKPLVDCEKSLEPSEPASDACESESIPSAPIVLSDDSELEDLAFDSRAQNVHDKPGSKCESYNEDLPVYDEFFNGVNEPSKVMDVTRADPIAAEDPSESSSVICLSPSRPGDTEQRTDLQSEDTLEEEKTNKDHVIVLSDSYDLTGVQSASASSPEIEPWPSMNDSEMLDHFNQQEAPATPEQAPASPQQAPATSEQAPASPLQAPATSEQSPLSPQQAPANLESPTGAIHTPKGAPTHKAYVPSPFTPMDSWDRLSDDQLKNRLRGFGLKDKMSRKRMIDALTQLYTETHQYETDTSAEFTIEPSPLKLNVETRLFPELEVGGNDLSLPDIDLHESSSQPTGVDVDLTISDESSDSTECKVVAVTKMRSGLPKSDIDKLLGEVDELLESEDELPRDETLNLNTSCSDSEDSDRESTDDTVEVRAADDLTPGHDLETTLRLLLRQNKEIYNRILHYEMIARDELVELVKSSGIKCSVKELQTFCFKQCIPVQHKQDQGRRRRKPSPKKAKKTSKTIIDDAI